LSSIRKFDKDSKIFVLFLDEESLKQGTRIFGEDVHPISLMEIESRYPELSQAKSNRSAMEYVFTLTPYLMRLVLGRIKENELAVYLDADLFFMGPPELVINDLGAADVGIIPHHYPEKLANSMAKYGQFNVGWVAIRNSTSGISCATWWAERCLENCDDEPQGGRYADQGYLDRFPDLFGGVRVLENRGFNLAPWNTSGQNILQDPNGHVLLGNQTPLTFFHFHGLKKFGKWMVTSQLNYRSPASKPLMEHVYMPYLRALQSAEKALKATTSGGSTRRLVRGKGLRKWARTLSGKLLMVASVITGNAVDMSKLK
jgi:hypothetical protein